MIPRPARPRLFDLESAVADQKNRERLLKKKREERDTKTHIISQLVRIAWRILLARAVGLNHSPSQMEVFKIPTFLPRSLQLREWVQHARNLLQGEAAAVEEGLPPLTYPSMEELTAALDGVDILLSEVDDYTRLVKVAQEKRKTRQKEGRHLLRQLALRLRDVLRDKEPGVKRDIMRTYGLNFSGHVQAEEGLEPQQQPEIQPINHGDTAQSSR